MMVYPVKSMAAVQASHQQGQQQQQSVQEARLYHGLKLKVQQLTFARAYHFALHENKYRPNYICVFIPMRPLQQELTTITIA